MIFIAIKVIFETNLITKFLRVVFEFTNSLTIFSFIVSHHFLTFSELKFDDMINFEPFFS